MTSINTSPKELSAWLKLISKSKSLFDKVISPTDFSLKINDYLKCQQHPGVFYAFYDFFNRKNDFDCIIEFGTGFGGLTEFLAVLLPDTPIHTFDNLVNSHFKSNGGPPSEQNRLSRYPNVNIYNQDVFDTNTMNECMQISKDKKTCWLFDGGAKNKEFETYKSIAEKDDLLLLHDFCRNQDSFQEIYINKSRWHWKESGFEGINLNIDGTTWMHEDLLELCLWGVYKKL